MVHAGGLCEPSLASVELSDEPVNAAITEPLQLMCGLVPSLCWGRLEKVCFIWEGMRTYLFTGVGSLLMSVYVRYF